MSDMELKKCDYDSLAPKSESYINEDEMEFKQQLKRKYKPESDSSAEDARILSGYDGSSLKTRLKSDTIAGEDKYTIQEFADIKPALKNIKSITGSSPELETIESHGKETHDSPNIKERVYNMEKAMAELKEHAQTQRISLSKEFTGTSHNFAMISPRYSPSEELTRELESKCFSRRNEECKTGIIHQAQAQHDFIFSEELSSKCFSRRNEEHTNGIIYQAQAQHDLAVISPRSSLSEQLTKELEFSNARSKLLTDVSRNQATEIKYQAEDLAVISPQSSLSEELTKEMKRRISSPIQEKEMKSHELTKELELHIAKNKLLTGRKRDIGIKSQTEDLVVISQRSSLSEELTKKMELRIARRALEKEMKAASIKPYIVKPDSTHQDRYSPYVIGKQMRRKCSQVSLPIATEGENLDQEVRRSLRPLFLSQIQREQANLIASVTSELKECLAKRNAENKDNLLHSIQPKFIYRNQAASRSSESTKLRMQARNV